MSNPQTLANNGMPSAINQMSASSVPGQVVSGQQQSVAANSVALNGAKSDQTKKADSQSQQQAAQNNLMMSGAPITGGPTAPANGMLQQADLDQVYKWINELSNAETRENALLELGKKRDSVPDLATMLWYSFGSITALLQEIITVYPSINPPTLTACQSNRVCNVLALLQCIASHHETRSAFLDANIPCFLYPFLHTSPTSKTRPFEYLRLTSLGVIGALVKTDEEQVINFLLSTEIIPLCLRIMETGSELSKTVATFILQKILLDETGLCYICQNYDRFTHVAIILSKMVNQLAKDPSARLLKHAIRCYLRLSDHTFAKSILPQFLPNQLKDSTFAALLASDKSTRGWLAQLMKNLESNTMQA